jgi:hypothetical protein
MEPRVPGGGRAFEPELELVLSRVVDADCLFRRKYAGWLWKREARLCQISASDMLRLGDDGVVDV